MILSLVYTIQGKAMPEVHTLTGFATLRRNVRLETIKIDVNLYLYRYTISDEKLAHGGDIHPSVAENPIVYEGITGDLGIAGLQNGDTTTANASRDWEVISDRGIELMRTTGFCRPNDLPQFEAEISKHPFRDFIENKITIDNVVRFDTSSQMLFDRYGEPLPKAIYGSYINGGFDNENYDLEKAAAHLMTRDDVFLAATRGFQEPDMQTAAISVIDAIHDIPHYNRSYSRNKCLYLLWRPSTENYRRVWKQASSYQHPSFYLWRAIFDLDLLGLRAIGASKRELSQA